MLAAGFELFHFEIYRAPPTRQGQCIFENVGDFADVRLDAPPVDELVVVGRHLRSAVEHITGAAAGLDSFRLLATH